MPSGGKEREEEIKYPEYLLPLSGTLFSLTLIKKCFFWIEDKWLTTLYLSAWLHILNIYSPTLLFMYAMLLNLMFTHHVLDSKILFILRSNIVWVLSISVLVFSFSLQGVTLSRFSFFTSASARNLFQLKLKVLYSRVSARAGMLQGKEIWNIMRPAVTAINSKNL